MEQPVITAAVKFDQVLGQWFYSDNGGLNYYPLNCGSEVSTDSAMARAEHEIAQNQP